jgi:hypothetical protein
MNVIRISLNRNGTYFTYKHDAVNFSTLAMVTPINVHTNVYIDLRNIQLKG